MTFIFQNDLFYINKIINIGFMKKLIIIIDRSRLDISRLGLGHSYLCHEE